MPKKTKTKRLPNVLGFGLLTKNKKLKNCSSNSIVVVIVTLIII